MSGKNLQRTLRKTRECEGCLGKGPWEVIWWHLFCRLTGTSRQEIGRVGFLADYSSEAVSVEEVAGVRQEASEVYGSSLKLL